MGMKAVPINWLFPIRVINGGLRERRTPASYWPTFWYSTASAIAKEFQRFSLRWRVPARVEFDRMDRST